MRVGGIHICLRIVKVRCVIGTSSLSAHPSFLFRIHALIPNVHVKCFPDRLLWKEKLTLKVTFGFFISNFRFLFNSLNRE